MCEMSYDELLEELADCNVAIGMEIYCISEGGN